MIPSGDPSHWQLNDNQKLQLIVEMKHCVEQIAPFSLPVYIQSVFELYSNQQYPPILSTILLNIMFNNQLRQQFIQFQPSELDLFDLFNQLVYNFHANRIDFFLSLTPDHIRTLLFQRCTAGAVEVTPRVSLPQLFAAANKTLSEKDNRTEICRAITKHNHRNNFTYWPPTKGSIQTMNEVSSAKMYQLCLVEIAWVNWFRFDDKGTMVYEVRNRDGYGIRWTFFMDADGNIANLELRGLLEPFVPEQMKGKN